MDGTQGLHFAVATAAQPSPAHWGRDAENVSMRAPAATEIALKVPGPPNQRNLNNFCRIFTKKIDKRND